MAYGEYAGALQATPAYQADQRDVGIPVAAGRVAMATQRLAQTNSRLSDIAQFLEGTLDRLAGGPPKPASAPTDQTRPARPDLDELDDIAQSLIDRCTHLEDLVKRAGAL